MVQIRLVQEEDLTAQSGRFLSLLLDAYSFSFSKIDEGTLTQIAEESLANMITFQKDGSAILIGAFAQAEIIGVLWAYERIVMGERRVHIGQFSVDAAWRRSGIGKQLISALEDIMRQRGIASLELMVSYENVNAILLYESLGFETERVQLVKRFQL